MTPRLSPDAWEAFLALHPDAHLLQSAAWGELKSRFGWDAVHVVEDGAGAQVLFRRLFPGMTLAYVPRGPVGDWLPGLLPALLELCRARGAFALKVEPDTPAGSPLEETLGHHRFRPSRHAIQPRRTLAVDVAGSENEILGRMHAKTRYNIHLSERKGVRVRPWDDVAGFHRLLQVTSERDAFGVHAESYYRRAYQAFHARGECELLVAEVEGRPLAALMVFARGRASWYLYGASSGEERQRMPTYLLQWEAMRWARRRGCTSYDLWGVPDEDEAVLEAGFSRRRDGLWGVYRFKRGFGGRLTRTTGAWDRPLRPLLYPLYLLAARYVQG